MESIITLEPVFKGKIWGGRKLETEFGYQIPDGPVGECWAISAHPNGDCVITSGEYEGKTLSWLWDAHRELFGNAEGDVFPLLVKIMMPRTTSPSRFIPTTPMRPSMRTARLASASAGMSCLPRKAAPSSWDSAPARAKSSRRWSRRAVGASF